MLILVMGVSGTGKSTVGQLLAATLGCAFIDADAYHSVANIEKMRRGQPLTDIDRAGWLGALHEAVKNQPHVVLACSALKDAYRQVIAAQRDDVLVVYLHGSARLIRQRMHDRTDHYMPPSLVDSQLATLEPPSNALIIDVADSPRNIVDAIVQRIDRD